MKKCDRAVITHGHGDHARRGHNRVLATTETLAFMRVRYGKRFAAAPQALAYGEKVRAGDTTVTLVPAGHVLGSAQVVIEWSGLRAVVAGDYKRRPDPTCEPFELVSCDLYVTEATFGLPVYLHPPEMTEIDKLMNSLSIFSDRPHLMGAYSLGKAQRLIALLRKAGHDQPIYVDQSVLEHCKVYEEAGVDLGPLLPLRDAHGTGGRGHVILAPTNPSSKEDAPAFEDPITGFASGWMRIRKAARGRGGSLPLILSDHADWKELTETIDDIKPRELWVQYGREDALCEYAREKGIVARALRDIGQEPSPV